jgi:hypothetical protein
MSDPLNERLNKILPRRLAERLQRLDCGIQLEARMQAVTDASFSSMNSCSVAGQPKKASVPISLRCFS